MQPQQKFKYTQNIFIQCDDESIFTCSIICWCFKSWNYKE